MALMKIEDEYGYCDTCKHSCREVNEEPCIHCRNNFVAGTNEYDAHELLWESATNDPVSHPKHYTQGGIECIDAMVSAFGKEAVANFCMCNAFKYIWRSKHKNGAEDIEKAKWYLNKHKELTANE